MVIKASRETTHCTQRTTAFLLFET